MRPTPENEYANPPKHKLDPASWLAAQASKAAVTDNFMNEFPATGSGLLDADGLCPGSGGQEQWALVFHDGAVHLGDLLGLSGQSAVPALAGYRFGIRWAQGVSAFPSAFLIEPVAKLGTPGTNAHPELPFDRDPTVLSGPWVTYDWQRAMVSPTSGTVTPGPTDRLFRLDFADADVGYLLIGEAPNRLGWFMTAPRWFPDPNGAALHDVRVAAVATEVTGTVSLAGSYYLRIDRAL